MHLQVEIFYYQLLGIVSAGSFIGEFWRTSSTDTDPRIFIANVLASAFLSMLLALGYYYVVKNQESTIILGGMLAFQDTRYLDCLARKRLDKGVGDV